MQSIIRTTIFTLLATTGVASAATSSAITPVEPITAAKATLSPTKDSHVSGTITFTETKKGLKVVADLTGLTPGNHGFHIHEFGDCSAADGASAGGHFNPTHTEHGAPDASMHHVGDLGNVVADASGKVHYETTDRDTTLNGPNSIIGRGVIVHAGADDMHTQPTGNSGGRVACGIVGVVK